MNRPLKKPSQALFYVCQNQLVLAGFESPFDQKMNPANQWVVLALLIPWDEICNLYLNSFLLIKQDDHL
jgi:transposase, IS5 family